jgi:hypothetical protein
MNTEVLRRGAGGELLAFATAPPSQCITPGDQNFQPMLSSNPSKSGVPSASGKSIQLMR